jgi:hypothetical protein
MIACGFYYDRDQMMQSTLDTLGDLFRRQIHGIRRCRSPRSGLCCRRLV